MFVPADEVHHKIRLTPENIDDPSIALNWDNLEALCEKCHHQQHDGVKLGRRRWRLTSDGVVVLPQGGGVSD